MEDSALPITSTVIGSTFVSMSDLDDEVQVGIDGGALARQQERRGIHRLDDGWPGDSVAMPESITIEHGTRDEVARLCQPNFARFPGRWLGAGGNRRVGANV